MNRRRMLLASAASIIASSSGLARAQWLSTYNDPDAQELEVWLSDADYWTFSDDVNGATGSSDDSGVCRVVYQANYYPGLPVTTVEYTSGNSFASWGDAAVSVLRSLTNAMYAAGLPAPPTSIPILNAHIGPRG